MIILPLTARPAQNIFCLLCVIWPGKTCLTARQVFPDLFRWLDRCPGAGGISFFYSVNHFGSGLTDAVPREFQFQCFLVFAPAGYIEKEISQVRLSLTSAPIMIPAETGSAWRFAYAVSWVSGFIACTWLMLLLTWLYSSSWFSSHLQQMTCKSATYDRLVGIKLLVRKCVSP